MGDVINDTTSWAALSALALPFIIALVNQPNWSGGLKRALAVVGAVVAAVLTCLGNGTLDDGKTVFQAFVLILVTSQALYGTLYHPAAKTVEAKVLNFTGSHEADDNQYKAA